MRRNLCSDFLVKPLQKPDMARFQAAEKPKRDSEFRRQRVFPAPYPLPYPALKRMTKVSANRTSFLPSIAASIASSALTG